MAAENFFFAGGGTGGHIYPAIAVAEQIIKLKPAAQIHFFCSSRDIDAKILNQAKLPFTPLPATGFSIRLAAIIRFASTFRSSVAEAKQILSSTQNSVVMGVGGFVAAPVCYAARKLKLPLALLNVDIIPGKANKLIARWADKIFVQFEDTNWYLGRDRSKATVTGCPLRSGFENLQPQKAVADLCLDSNKKILLITGASSGSARINEAVFALLDKLSSFAETWQVVHIVGVSNYHAVKDKVANAKISYKVLDYYDDMPNLLAVAGLVIGRSGAVSVAEYAAAAVPSICLPYPHHKDMHQYLNAEQLVEAGAAVIVDDLPDLAERAGWLWEELEPLLKDDRQRKIMKDNCSAVAKKSAAAQIAEYLVKA